MGQMGPRERQLLLEAEKRARHIFWGSLVLSVLLVLHIVYLARTGDSLPATVRAFLPPLLLWSLMVTGYAFVTMSRISRQKAPPEDAIMDPATGVYSLAYLDSWLARERLRIAQGGKPAAVVYLDLVNLDRVNDQFGHAVGDIVLKAVAQRMTAQIRSGDILGRAGGDEFVVILPETAVQAARPIVKALKAAVRQYQMDLGKKGRIDFLSCRAGLAAFPSEGETPAEVIAAARAHLEETASS